MVRECGDRRSPRYRTRDRHVRQQHLQVLRELQPGHGADGGATPRPFWVWKGEVMSTKVLTVMIAASLSLAANPSYAQQQPAAQSSKPNILVIFGDDIGVTNVSAYSLGLVGYRTPNIDRIAKEGMLFTDYYAEQSCTAGRSAFITGIATLRTGLSKVGAPV